ncbi:MAG: patatin-like phospholipase family protein [Candidatus Omnitrophota bacterium]|nr:patatin-like phospholipase family protein [Candidatus Omnitrophota bacterium]
MSNLSSLINRFHLLKQIPVFSKLHLLDLHRIARKTIVAEYKKGDIIAKEGNPPDYFYCLVSGRIRVYTDLSEGRKEGIDFIHRGNHFGVISVLTGENHSLTYEAINDSVLLQIAVDDFRGILKTVPQLGIELSHILSQRLRRQVKGTKTIFESNIISIYSPVKGTGSSTYAIHLALRLAKETKKKVIFVSIHTENSDGRRSEADVSPWKKSAVPLSNIVGDHDLILANIIKDDLDVDLLNVSLDREDSTSLRLISPFVSSLVGNYHYVVVDLPNDMDDVVLETLTQSDAIHLMSTDSRKDLDLVRRVIDRLEIKLKDRFREEKIKIIIRSLHEKIYLSFEEIDKVLDFPVYTALPTIHSSDLIAHVTSPYFNFQHCHDKSEYTKAVTRIAREIGGVLVGLALGGGAALGLAHIGIIRVLEQEDIPIDIVVGSSMGALIGSLWAAGKNAQELEVVAREFEKQSSITKLLDPPAFPISGLVRGAAIRRWLTKHLGNRTFYSTRIPLRIVAYDLIHREELILNSGSLVDAVCKSIAIPGVIRPTQEGDRLIIDGGVLNPLPTNVLASMGIKKIIAINVLQSPEQVYVGHKMTLEQTQALESVKFTQHPWKYFSYRLLKMLGKPFNPNIADIIVRTLQATEFVIAEQSAHQADVVIHPDLAGINWFELYKVDELIKRGEDAAHKHLPAIKKLIAE